MSAVEAEEACVLVNAATVVILRYSRGEEKEGNLEVLLGQSAVKNWMRSTKEKTCLMRYPGEWKFPGGALDLCDQGNLQHTAIREMREEFIGIAPHVADEEIILHKASMKYTLPNRGKRFLMHNFVAIEDDNEWVRDIDVQAIQSSIERRLTSFHAALDDESFWDMDEAGRSELSPELVQVQWVPIQTAVEAWRTSLTSSSESLECVNEWQRTEFERYGVTKRDPMYQTMMVLKEVGELGTIENIKVRAATMQVT